MWSKQAKNRRQKNQTKKQPLGRNIKLAIIVLGVLLAVLILGKLLAFVESLSQPLTPKIAAEKFYRLDGQSAVNIVVAAENPLDNEAVSIISLHPTEKRAVILKVSNQIYTELAKGFGSWRVGSIYGLGQQENPPIGVDLLKLSLSKLLALPIDGVILVPVGYRPQDIIEDWRKNPFSMLTAAKFIQTDLTPVELFRLQQAFAVIRADKVYSLDLAQSEVTFSKLLPDSSRVLGVSSVKLDLFIREKMADDTIMDEGKSIAVFNATSHPGLAQEAARMITNLGGNTVIISSSDKKQEKSAILIREKGDTGKVKISATGQRLTEIFAPACLNSACQVDDPKILSSRAEINIILGEDYYGRWYTR